MENKQTKEFLQYQFSHDEIHQKGLELARLASEAEAIENERKSVASEFKAKLDSIGAQMHTLGNHINNGYEHRYIECTVKFHDPNTGIKSTYRNDTGELVSKATMTGAEMQEEIEFERFDETPDDLTDRSPEAVAEMEAKIGAKPTAEAEQVTADIAGFKYEGGDGSQESPATFSVKEEARPRRGRPPRQD